MIGLLREPTRGEITRLAYALYLLRGDWVKAEKELCNRLIGQLQPIGAAHTADSHLRPVWFDKSSNRICD